LKLEVLVWCALVAVVAIAQSTPTPTPTTNPVPPDLPYHDWTSWAVTNVNTILANGSTVENSSWGQNVDVATSLGLVCKYNKQQLFPVPLNVLFYTTLHNYTAHLYSSQIVSQTGAVSNCTEHKLTDTMPIGGPSWAIPSKALRNNMTFVNYTTANNLNCSIWTYRQQLGANFAIYTWQVEVGTGAPCVYVNQSFNVAAGTSVILTTAFDGFQPLEGGVSPGCDDTLTCGEQICVANRNARPKAIQAALSWVCGQEDCSYLKPGGANFWPNQTDAHADYAFNEYFQNNKWQGPGACAFGGAGELVNCPTVCTNCNVSTNATTAQIQAALKFVCSIEGYGNCSVVEPGGANYYPNTLFAHATVMFGLYYNVYRCVPSIDACGFKGAAEVNPCN